MANKEYRLELAVCGVNEFKALDKLTEIFGPDFKHKVPISGLSRRSGLIFIEYSFLESELDDGVYTQILKSKDVTIVSDALSLERSHQMLGICLPVEVLLKKLLIYVYSGIVDALERTSKEKTKIDFCCFINGMTFGGLLNILETDLAAKTRKRLLAAGNEDLISLAIASSSFGEFQDKLREQTRKRTVWDEVQMILEQPVPYDYVAGQLRKLLRLRNKAAHLQTITERNLKEARKSAEHVLGSLSNIRDDYKDELKKAFAEFVTTMREVVRQIGPEEIARANKELCDTIGKAGEDFLETVRSVLDDPDSVKDMKTRLALKQGEKRLRKNEAMGDIMHDIEEKGLINSMHDMGLGLGLK